MRRHTQLGNLAVLTVFIYGRKYGGHDELGLDE
jgi:hypothetical protein